MKLGLVFPTCDIGSDPVAIRDYAQGAEALGFDSLLTFDHVLGAEHAGRVPPLAGPYDESFPFHEPFVLLAFLAAATQRIELATGVLVLPQRATALVAKQASELQNLSRGRLRLGVGTGWNRIEAEALGSRWAGRGRRFDEQIALLRELWSASAIDFAGEFHRIDRAGILPLPERRIPLWFGGASARAYERAARAGDGFVFRPDDREYGAELARIRDRMRKLGRDPGGFGAECTVSYARGPEHWLARLAHWRAAGGTHFSVQAHDFGAEKLGAPAAGLAGVGDHLRALERFAGAVRGALRQPG